MLATFCLRLAGGLAGALLLLSPAQVAPRFYRVQFLTILGLGAGAAFLLWSAADPLLIWLLAAGLLFSFGGSIAWSLEGAPAGRTLIVLDLLALAAALMLTHLGSDADGQRTVFWPTLDDWSSAAL